LEGSWGNSGELQDISAGESMCVGLGRGGRGGGEDVEWLDLEEVDGTRELHDVWAGESMSV